MRLTNPLSLLLSLTSLASSTRLQLSINPSSSLQDPSSLPPSTHATLSSASTRISVPLRRDNTFLFPDLEIGDYLVDIHTRDYVFPSLRLDVLPDISSTPSTSEAETTEEQDKIILTLTHPSNPWSHKGAKLASSTTNHPGQLLTAGVSVLARRDFYQHRTGFDLLGFFKSPMILMGVFSMAMVFGMPYLMENMDPETKAEFEEMQKSGAMGQSQGAAQSIQNFDLAGWMAGKTDSSSGTQQVQKSGGGVR